VRRVRNVGMTHRFQTARKAVMVLAVNTIDAMVSLG
jgi:hypothetical protein